MRMLFISAHPDDAFLGAGGVILKHASLMDEIAIINVTSAEKGLPLVEEAFLKAVRKKEQSCICDKIGVTVEFLDVPDLRTSFLKEELLSLVIVRIRQFAPHAVFTHFLSDVHPDHESVSTVVKAACHLSAFPKVCPDEPPHTVAALFMWEEYSTQHFVPSLYVDITSEYKRKKEMLKEYKTQYPILKDVFAHAELQPRIRGIESGVMYAEAFHCPWPVVVDALSHIGRRSSSS